MTLGTLRAIFGTVYGLSAAVVPPPTTGPASIHTDAFTSSGPHAGSLTSQGPSASGFSSRGPRATDLESV